MTKEILKCNLCNREFKYNSLLAKHQNNKKSCKIQEIYTHKCDLCNKYFKYNSQLIKHKNNKRKCIDIKDKNNEEIKRLYNNILQQIKDKLEKSNKDKCYFCDKSYSTKGNLKNHINNNCKIFIQLKSEKDKFKKLINNNKKDNELEKIKQELQKIKETIPTATNINIQNNINITNNNELHIHINNFGKEDLSHISNNDYKQYIKDMYTGLINLIKHVHCSKDKPQNYNVYLTNFKGKYIKIFKDNMWLIDDMDDVIDQLKDDKISILNKKVEELNDLKLKQTLETFKGRLYSNAVAEKNLNNNIKLVLYNNQQLAINYSNKLKN